MKTNKILMSILALAFITTTAMAQLSIGDKAPGFKLKNIDHQWVSLDDYKDQEGVIVVFSCNHCPYVVMYESRMIELQKKFAPKKFPLIAINPNDSTIVPADGFSHMITNAADKGFNFPYVLDDQKIWRKYGATRTPHVYLLKNEGDHFSVAYIGAIDDNARDANDVNERYVAQAIDAILNGQEPPVTETRAVGCTIKFNE